MAAAELLGPLQEFFALGPESLSGWIRRHFIEKFYGPVPHPFVAALQRPTKAVLLGYAVEHQHFLRQWVRSCALITARTSEPEVIRYELDNLVTEFGGSGPERPSHYELLLRMGESLGMDRSRLLALPPLPITQAALDEWNRIANQEPWVEAMAAMHALELIANRDLVKYGASTTYFDPTILIQPLVTEATQAFLREGYAADVGHSEAALGFVERFAREPGQIEAVQATYCRSADLFDDYLMARLERAGQLEG